MIKAILTTLMPLIIKFLESEAKKIPNVNQELVDKTIEAMAALLLSLA